MNMRVALLILGRVFPYCFLVLIPGVAVAESLPASQGKSMIETAETVMAVVTADTEGPSEAQSEEQSEEQSDTQSGRPIEQQPEARLEAQSEVQPEVQPDAPPADEQPVFRYERVPSQAPEESLPESEPEGVTNDSDTENESGMAEENAGESSTRDSSPNTANPTEVAPEGTEEEPLDGDADGERPDEAILGEEGLETEGISEEGSPEEGISAETILEEGIPEEGIPQEEISEEEVLEEGISEEEVSEEEVSEEYLRWQQLLMEGDRLFLQGRYLEAEAQYQEAKDPEDDDPDPVDRPEAFTDPARLSTAGQVYWREYQAGLESGMETRIHVPLELLTQEFPEFIPAQIEYALLLSESEEDAAKQEAVELLEQGTALFPDNADLAWTRVEFLADEEEWLQAAIAARQFAVLNPDAPEHEEFELAADEYQRKFRSRLRGQLTRNAIGNVIMGGVGFALTGNLFGPFSALETTVMMLRGESAIGESIANRAAEELDLIEDDEVVSYVNEIGQELASLAGRDEFDYEFYVVEEDDLNAFALPGGKVFVNAGAILSTETEAELAGLIAHELAHAVLSHGFQMMTSGNLTANVLQLVPYGGYVTNLAVLRYSRGMERQADRLGTQLLANSHYAADGLHRLMITLHEEGDRRGRFDWLSTHPDTPERIRNLDRLIDENGYNRYAFEGIERHLQIRDRVEQLLREADKLDDEDDITLDESPDDSSL